MLLLGSRLLAALGCFALAGWAVYAIVGGSPDLVTMAWWFAGAVLLPRTRVPLVNHVRIPVLGSGLALLMFLPGIIRQGALSTLNATGLDQEPYRMRWVWLTVVLFAVSALVWTVRTLLARRAVSEP